MNRFANQMRSNAVALLSLVIALSALGYNTWRNERTEQQRNIRSASFRVLETIGELREVVDERYYYLPFRQDMSAESSLRLRGFGHAALTRDLMSLMPAPAPASGEALHADWVAHFNHLDDLDESGQHSPAAVAAEQAIGASLEEARRVVLQVIAQLD